jgi:DNA (cytosine-5)-methyltransferase 1
MIKVIELFAGVGGFRLGLEGFNNKSASSEYTEPIDSPYQVIWSNQWEPSTKKQHASMVYEKHWGEHSNVDINQVDINSIPDHDLLVGGFPCQDYSVASTNSTGIIGKKGVLWWNIHSILKDKLTPYVLLENVDRLLVSPAKQRGRDFAIMLQSLNQLGYIVEWRVINAADYGLPQRRKRTFIYAYRSESVISSPFTFSFPMSFSSNETETFELKGDLKEISENFNKDGDLKFQNTGVMVKGVVTTSKGAADYDGKQKTLGDVILHNFSDEFLIDNLDRWEYLKGAKKEKRKKGEFEYFFTEGKMTFPDALDRPSRTIITAEGGNSPSRFKHVIETPQGFRRLIPIELERLCGFPDDFTKMDGITDTKRAFFMGNALVVPIIEKIGLELKKIILD